MYCTKCNRHTDSERCPECGGETLKEAPHVVYWCDSCNVPVIRVPESNKTACPICGSDAYYLCADLRPVFPEERLLFEILIGEPYAFMGDSVWAVGSKYYVNGIPYDIAIKELMAFDPAEIRTQLDRYAQGNDGSAFERHIEAFVKANRAHKDAHVREACDFIVDTLESDLVKSPSGRSDLS